MTRLDSKAAHLPSLPLPFPIIYLLGATSVHLQLYRDALMRASPPSADHRLPERWPRLGESPPEGFELGE